ncbi:MAG: sporulation transcriptional regulator SpoIIID [Clostridia bacterium]|nr:sporulation transcriptional regulator SpoIIID [Clostridia bacterium]
MIDTHGRPRCELFGKYIVNNEATVRKTAVYFGISKSTVHKDVTEHLKKSDPILFEKVSEVLKKHKEVRHLRGGEATRNKYLKLKQIGGVDL